MHKYVQNPVLILIKMLLGLTDALCINLLFLIVSVAGINLGLVIEKEIISSNFYSLWLTFNLVAIISSLYFRLYESQVIEKLELVFRQTNLSLLTMFCVFATCVLIGYHFKGVLYFLGGIFLSLIFYANFSRFLLTYVYTVFPRRFGWSKKLAQLFEASKYKGFIESQIGMTNKDIVPFWMRSNQFGSIPATGLSNSWLIGFQKNLKQIESTDFSSFDWGLNFESRVNLAGKSTVDLIEGNLNAKWWIFLGKIGRSKDLMGLNGDSTLSSGNFSISGNSLGIPKMEVIIPNFYRIPVMGGLISIKGNFALGYIGKTRMNPGVFLVKTENHKMETFHGRLQRHLEMKITITIHII